MSQWPKGIDFCLSLTSQLTAVSLTTCSMDGQISETCPLERQVQHYLLMGAAMCSIGLGMQRWLLTGEIWAQSLSQWTSAQKADLVALTQALSWGSVLYQEHKRKLKIRDLSPPSSYLVARKTFHHPLPRAPEEDLTEARGNRFGDTMAEGQPLSQCGHYKHWAL